MRRAFVPLLALLLLVGLAGRVAAHCQVPCGIYDDEQRFAQIEEHLTTIEKAMNQITELSAAETPNWNQIVRWVTTKETHAQEIQDIVSAYFLTQRIKPAEGDGAADYVKSLEMCHSLLVQAMKCKQTTDTANVGAARGTLTAFHALYFKDKTHDHE